MKFELHLYLMYHMAKNRILIVGINPSDRKNIEKNSTLHRLERWMNQLEVGTYSFVNIISEPGDYNKQDIDYDRIKDLSEYHNKILALGNFVSEALNKVGIGHYKLPHPSPLNRKLNDKEFESKVLIECGKYLGE